MELLFLSPWCPWPADNGSKLRIYHLLRGLSQRHRVDLLSFCPERPTAGQEAHLRGICREVQLVAESPFAGHRRGRMLGLLSAQPRSMVGNFNPRMAALVRRHLRERRYDAVVASQLHMAPYALLAGQVPTVIEEVELAGLHEQFAREEQPLRRLRYWLTWWKTQRYVGSIAQRLGGATVVAPAEYALVAQCTPRTMPLAIVPNGVDVAGYAGNFGLPEPDTLVYPGALSYAANFDAVAYFVQAILPRIHAVRPGVRLRITGRATPAQIAALPQTEGVEFTGYLDDVRPTIARSWAEVVPLRKGGGTRLKVLEALALGTPVIATSKGVEGLGLQQEYEVLVADRPDEFAAQTLRLLGSPELRHQLVQNGQRAAAGYDWHLSIERLDELLAQAAEQNRQGTTRWSTAHSR